VVAGTRKTTPGFRQIEKYSLIVGGCAPHRYDLSQMVMLKDNHIWATGSITNAVKRAKAAAGFAMKIEVECQNEAEAVEACESGADIIMLDNFSSATLQEIVTRLKERFPNILIEASGVSSIPFLSSSSGHLMTRFCTYCLIGDQRQQYDSIHDSRNRYHQSRITHTWLSLCRHLHEDQARGIIRMLVKRPGFERFLV
jgi:hypothetical protein